MGRYKGGVKSLEERLLLHVRDESPTGCWEWTGFLDGGGYGAIRDDSGHKQRSHRAAASVWRDFDLDSNLKVLHRCDNPPCINPQHLFFGTQRDNIEDMCKKGRQRRKLEPAQLEEIERRLRAGEFQSAVAADFKVTQTLVSRIMRRSGIFRPHTALFGAQNARAKLTDPVVAELRRRRSSGESLPSLAKRFGIGTSTVHRVVTGKSWGHVK